MKKLLFLALAIVVFSACTKTTIYECKTVSMSQFNTRTGATTVIFHDTVMCGNHLAFLKPNGFKESFTVNDTTYYLITETTLK